MTVKEIRNSCKERTRIEWGLEAEIRKIFRKGAVTKPSSTENLRQRLTCIHCMWDLKSLPHPEINRILGVTQIHKTYE